MNDQREQPMTQAVMDAMLQLKTQRIAGIQAELAAWASEPFRSELDPRGTPLYSIEEQKRAYTRRFTQLAVEIQKLSDASSVISATILARALIETIAMGCYFIDEIERLIVAGNVDNFKSKIYRFMNGVGSVATDYKPIHVNDALRHLENLDAEYQKMLKTKHAAIANLALKVVAQSKNLSPSELAQAENSVLANYDFLSDFAHPNGPGTFLIYGDPDHPAEFTQPFMDRLKQLCSGSIWHGHYLLSALERGHNTAERYLKQFPKVSS